MTKEDLLSEASISILPGSFKSDVQQYHVNYNIV